MDRPIRRILAPIEFAELSEPEVDYAIEVAAQLDAELHLFGVIDRPTMLSLIGKHQRAGAAGRAAQKAGPPAVARPSFDQAMIDEASGILQRIVDRAAEVGVEARGHVTVSEHVADRILTEARQQEADLILVHTKPLSLLHRALFGNTVEEILRDAPCPVLVSNA